MRKSRNLVIPKDGPILRYSAEGRAADRVLSKGTYYNVPFTSQLILKLYSQISLLFDIIPLSLQCYVWSSAGNDGDFGEVIMYHIVYFDFKVLLIRLHMLAMCLCMGYIVFIDVLVYEVF